jgi:hypothetical protein
LITQPSASRRATVAIPAGSDPAPASESASAGAHSPLAQRGSSRRFCSSLPNRRIGSVPTSWSIRISALAAQAFATSSIATFIISVPVPVPPYSASNGSASMSWSANSRRRSHG